MEEAGNMDWLKSVRESGTGGTSRVTIRGDERLSELNLGSSVCY